MLDLLFAAAAAGGGASEPSDPDFSKVVLLTRADGSNGQGNSTFTHTKDGSSLTASGTATTNYLGTASTTGMPSWCWNFNGSNQFLTAAGSNDFVFDADFTIECWVYLRANNVDMAFVTNHNISNGLTWQLGLGATGVLELMFNSPTTEQIIGTTSVATYQWHHVAVSRSGSDIKLFLNGVQEGSTFSSAATTGSASYVVGVGGRSPNSQPTNGLLSNVRIVKGTALYTSTFTPPTAQLTAISGTSLLCCHKPYARNEGSAGGVLTLNNAPLAFPGAPIAQNSPGPHDYPTHGGTSYHTTTWLTGTNSDLGTIGTGDFTIEGWVYVTGSNFSGMFSSSPNPTTGPAGIGIIWETNRTPFVLTGKNASGQFSNLSAGTAMAANRWYHLAATRESGTLRIFMDGILKASSTPTIRTIVNTEFVLGNYYAGSGATSGGALAGRVSGVRVVNGTALYTADFVPSSAAPANITGTSILYNSTGGGYIDAAGYNTFRLYNSAALSTTQVKFGATSLSLNGTNQYAESEPSPHLHLTSANTWTMEAWIYPTALGSTRTIIGIGDGGSTWSTNLISQFSVTAAGELSFQYGSSSTVTSSGAGMTTNNWYHVVAVMDGATDTLQMYVNGTRYYNNTVTFTATQTLPRVTIGRTPTGNATGQFFSGYIDDVRITNGVKRYDGASYTVPTATFPVK